MKPKNIKTKKFRCKSQSGYSCRWMIGETVGGGFQVLMMGRVKIKNNHIPNALVPFELMNAVYNSPNFNTLEECEHYVRTL